MKQLRKKALLPALSMALASVIALSGVTYAWFTTSNTASVKGMDVNVQAANGIQISLDAKAWRSTINGTEIQAFAQRPNYTGADTKYPVNEIMPVSTAGKVENGKMVMFEGGIDNGTLFSNKAETVGNNANYIAFDLFFKSTSSKEEGQPLSLVIGPNESDLSKVIATNFFGGSTTANIESAVRVAFVPLGCEQDVSKAQALKNGDKALIWEPAPNMGPNGTTHESVDTMGFNQAFSGLTEEELGDKVTAVKADITGTGEKFITTLHKGINKVRVYIWLEGQDIDCVNDISYGDFTTLLHFSVPEAEEG